MSLYRIGTAARLSGLEISTLRNWESRYALVVPTRTGGDQRLYSADDIKQLTALKALVDQGLSAGEAHNVVRERPLRPSSVVASHQIHANAQRVRREVAEDRGRAMAAYEREYDRLRELLKHATGLRAESLRQQAETARIAAERVRTVVASS